MLQYADDTLLLFKGNVDQAKVIKEILNIFSDFTGLQINFHKSTLVPISVDEGTAAMIAEILGCPLSAFLALTWVSLCPSTRSLMGF